MEKNIHLVQLPTNQGLLSTFDWKKGPGDLAVDEEVVKIRFKNNRKASPMDLEKWMKAKKREREVLLEARRISSELGLKINISDVEFQGDGRKATVVYRAEGRVDFRELIRLYTAAFRVKVEMRQAGSTLFNSLNKKVKRLETGSIT